MKTSTSQALPSTEFSCRTPLDEKQFCWCNSAAKYNLRESITKEDMIKHHQKIQKPSLVILKKASELMVLAFGIEVKEVNPTTVTMPLSADFSAPVMADCGVRDHAQDRPPYDHPSV